MFLRRLDLIFEAIYQQSGWQIHDFVPRSIPEVRRQNLTILITHQVGFRAKCN